MLRPRMRPAARALALVSVLALALGCAARPVTRLTFVTTQDALVEPEILATDVERSWCFTITLLEYAARFPWRASLVPDYGYAVLLALRDVPGSNVMVDVEVERKRSEYLLFRRVCSSVRGDVGRIQ
jgi:hypothetical protein